MVNSPTAVPVCLSFSRIVFVCLAALLALAVPAADAAAQGRRARLSDDLVRRLQAGDTANHTIIVTGSPAQVSGLAQRHGLTVRKRLKTGAVLDVPAGALDALTRDGGVDQLSGNHRLRSQMAITNTAIGADQAWEGIAGIPGVTGEGVGVAIIDSGIADVPALRGRVWRASTSPTGADAGSIATATARTWRASWRRRGEAGMPRRAAWRRARTWST